MHNFTPKGWRHIQLYKNIYKLNNVHKLNKQRHSNNIQIKWKQIQTCHLLFTNTERVPFGTTQTRRSLRKGLENIKAHLKLSFVRDKYITLKREYIKSLSGHSNVSHDGRKIRCVPSNIYQLLWNIENSNQLPQQLKHMRTKFYIYVIPEYHVPWLDIYKYPLPDTCTRWGVSLDILTKWHTVEE
jgi:hypothetical protein